MIYLQKNIKYLKEKNNLSMQAICDGSGIGSQTIMNLVHTDGLNTTLISIIKIAEYFGVSIDDLIYKDLRKESF